MTKTTFLGFEQQIAELETKIEELRYVQDDSAVDISEEIDRLSQKPDVDEGYLCQINSFFFASISNFPSSATTIYARLYFQISLTSMNYMVIAPCR